MTQYTPGIVPLDVKALPEYLNNELNKLAGDLDILRYLKISKEYTLSASATVTITDNDLTVNGLAWLSLKGENEGSTAIHINRNGSTNGTWGITDTSAGSTWNHGTTSEPAGGTYRSWIESASANARMLIKGTGSGSRKLRILSVEF